MPIMEAASYHGYDVTDYRAVEARLRHRGRSRGTSWTPPTLAASRSSSTSPQPHLDRASLVQGCQATGFGARRLVRLGRYGPRLRRARWPTGLASSRRSLVLRALLGPDAGPRPARPGRDRRARLGRRRSGSTTWAWTASGSTPPVTWSRTVRSRRTRRRHCLARGLPRGCRGPSTRRRCSSARSGTVISERDLCAR